MRSKTENNWQTMSHKANVNKQNCRQVTANIKVKTRKKQERPQVTVKGDSISN